MEGEIKKIISGEVFSDDATRETYSHDASLFEVKPQLVVFPKSSKDISALVKYARSKKKDMPGISLTPRSAGTCMSGGSLTESIVFDFTKYITGVISIAGKSATVLPGTYYRDFEKETLARGLILPCYTASKNICAIGGMIGNNCAGEKTLLYGKMEKYIESLKVIFSDGNEYTVKPLSRSELDGKLALQTFEGEIYRDIWNIILKNESLLADSKPKVSKNSAGYYIWNVWDGKAFDLTKLLVGSQGTLGIVTEATLRLVPVKKKSKLFVIFLKDLTYLSELVNVILKHNPESLESYDDSTMSLAVRFFPEMVKTMKVKSLLKLGISFLPEVGMVLTGGLPKLILLVEFSGNEDTEIDGKMRLLEVAVRKFPVKFRVSKTENESEKYWTIRRESFNLLRKHVHGRRTAPFIDDVVVDPKFLPEFLPKMRKILDEAKLVYTIAGHAGNGNFHIIPLMDMKKPESSEVILDVSNKVYDLVAAFGGSITAEHNDGIVRTPYLYKMYSPEMLSIFEQIKNIFDPEGIFNPGKKVGGTIEYFKKHLVNTS
jgi:FAD/FMN-containing dehydrogenase